MVRTAEALHEARVNLLSRVPMLSPLSQSTEMHLASAKWTETCRLKRLTRWIKMALNQPLVATDWTLPHGLVVVQGGPTMRAAELCSQLATNFDAHCIEAKSEAARRGAVGVAESWAEREDRADTCFLEGTMTSSNCEQARQPRPPALAITCTTNASWES